jgi:hypothetical protein
MTTPATPPAPDRPELATQFVPLFRGTWRLAEYLTIPRAPAGTRLIAGITQGRIDGDRVSASLTGAASADWLTIGADQIGTVDFRGTVQTDDGALIYLHGPGRIDLSGGMGSRAPLYGGALFETSDKRYTWLNSIVAAWKGMVIDGVLYDEYFQLH